MGVVYARSTGVTSTLYARCHLRSRAYPLSMAATPLPQEVWSVVGPQLLSDARRSRRHSQEKCAERLNELGAEEVGQRTVSDWECGRTNVPSEANLAAIAAYVVEAGAKFSAPRLSVVNEPPASGVPSPPSSEAHTKMSRYEVERAVADRIRAGPSLSRWDIEAIRLLLRE